MKEALLFGWNKTIDNYWSVLKKSFPLYLSVTLVSLGEAMLFYEGLLLIQRAILGLDLSYLSSVTELSPDTLLGEQAEGYLYDMARTTFGPVILFNSFFIGVYYSHVGFPVEKESQEGVTDLLDAPLEHRSHSVGEMMNYIGAKEWQNYLIFFGVFFLISICSNGIAEFLYEISSALGYGFYLFLDRVVYLLLLIMYWRFGAQKTWDAKGTIWVIIVFFILLPGIDNYITWQLKGALISGVSVLGDVVFHVTNIAHFGITILFGILWLPVVAILYAQTFLKYGYEENA